MLIGPIVWSGCKFIRYTSESRLLKVETDAFRIGPLPNDPEAGCGIRRCSLFRNSGG